MQTLLILFGVAFLLSLLPFAWWAARAYGKFRGRGVLTCPETRAPVAVELDAVRAALAEVTGDGELRLQSCSRWPERQDCGQDCLQSVEQAPEECLVRNVLAKSCEGSICWLCGREIGRIRWMDHQPALLGPDRKTREWDEIPSQEIPEAVRTQLPVCWDCHMAKSFRAAHPELVLDDPLHRAPRRSRAS